MAVGSLTSRSELITNKYSGKRSARCPEPESVKGSLKKSLNSRSILNFRSSASARVAVLVAVICCVSISANAQESTRLEDTLNFHKVSESLFTAGQIYPLQVPDLQSQGVELVVNLAVADAERNGGESLAVIGAGISYVHIPVLWTEPTSKDLQLFFAMMDAGKGRKTLVHCFANYRASAFTFLYRVLQQDVPLEEAKVDLYAVWDDEAFAEYPVWLDFITTTLAAEGLTL
ncbi:MAG: protein tyrosine phosphatase family protein [Pseudomonadota bacterium]